MKYILLVQFLLLSFLNYSQTLSATFKYQYENDQAKGGKFVFQCPDPSLSFESDAAAGYLVASDNPYYQTTKDKGPIPNGTWIIYAIKDESKNILRLRATEDVLITIRDGFLIHGIGVDSSPEKSSKGCIILAPEYRKKLVAAFKR